MDKALINQQYERLTKELLSEQNSQGFWSGQLSSSALAVSVSITALKLARRNSWQSRCEKGLQWLFNHVNADGGFGDTPKSVSNVSTSLLCMAAIHFCSEGSARAQEVLLGLKQYVRTQNIDFQDENWPKAILNYYGRDYTFSVPILAMMSICGLLPASQYKLIPQLPFELARFPNRFYRFLNLQVVSYAIPALIAVGIYTFTLRKKRLGLYRELRKTSLKPCLQKLENSMPESGGFLEAIPLTAFVSMCLVSSGHGEHRVVNQGLAFIENQQREDGSWPIDTDLSTWVTTLSVKALGGNINKVLSAEQQEVLVQHLLQIQSRNFHAFNQSMPGGWGWTNYSGSVPDADDTSGAILALLVLDKKTNETNMAILNGCNWLMAQQNSDGGMPTFCRGWGRLPFDQSTSDLSGHALAALSQTLLHLGSGMDATQRRKIEKSIAQLLVFLRTKQHSEGYWLPLWFGNQQTHEMQNPVYGTARISVYLSMALDSGVLTESQKQRVEKMHMKACLFLVNQQNSDGSWGGAKKVSGTIEETSLCITALRNLYPQVCGAALIWLENHYQQVGMHASPIGLYFAKLWYDERLYPLTAWLEAVNVTYDEIS